MNCNNESALEQIKADFFSPYFKDLPESAIELAIATAECMQEAITMKSCPRLYQAWIVGQAQLLLLDAVDGVDDEGAIVLKPANLPPTKMLKKRTTLDITCEWEAVKTCKSCDQGSRDKIKTNVSKAYSTCVKSMKLGAHAAKCPPIKHECRPCLAVEFLR